MKSNELYLNSFSHSDHAALASFLCEDRAFPWLLTYDDAPAIRKLYESVPQVLFSLSYSAYERRKGNELLMYARSEIVSNEALACLPVVAA
jgi:DNA adenine methylase